MKSLIVVPLTAFLFTSSAHAFGPRGHQLVGAIADKRLAEDEQAANAVSQLLEGLTLERAATLPDELKSFDDCSRPPSTKPLKVPKRINDELQAFRQANPWNVLRDLGGGHRKGRDPQGRLAFGGAAGRGPSLSGGIPIEIHLG